MERDGADQKVRCVASFRTRFGIYLLHDFTIQLFEHVGFTAVIINPVFAVPLRVLSSFLICLVMVFAWKKITERKLIHGS